MKGTSYFGLRGRLCLFEILKIFYPPKGVCEAAPKGSIWRSFHFMCSRKGTGHLRFWSGNPRFRNLRNVLSPEGSCECRSRMGSNWFLLCFNYSELCSRNVLGCFKMRLIIRLLKILKMLYCDGWMDGLVGGDFLPPWIFFIFKYNKKQNELLPKMCLKVVSAY